ncbi:MAG: FG-GAP repeat protein, partial [Bacteroidota bacterium]
MKQCLLHLPKLSLISALFFCLFAAQLTAQSDYEELQKLVASDAEAGDGFGGSVSISGDYAIVGARLEDPSDGMGGTLSNAGAAYIFERSATGWTQVQKLVASDAEASDGFGGSVSISGDYAIVGAAGEDPSDGMGGTFMSAGAAYIFERSATGWTQVKKLVSSDAEFGGFFGVSVSISGDYAIVGANGEDPSDGMGGTLFSAGAAYIFERDAGGVANWGEVKKLVASDAQGSDGFGGSVSISGDYAMVGANGEDPSDGMGGTLPDAGAAYIFERDAGGMANWGEVKKLVASDAEVFDQFGISVSISGDYAIVGAFREDPSDGMGGTLSRAGSAYIFERDAGGMANWGEVKKLVASDAQAGDEFGFSVSISGDYAIVGARLEDPSDGMGGTLSDAGSAYIFERDAGGMANWGEVEKLVASDAQASDLFGFSVSISGDYAIVGAILEDPSDGMGGTLSDAGSAYIFGPTPCPDLSTAPSNVSITDASCGSGCTTTDGSFTLPTNPCPDGASIQYSIDGGAFGSTEPVYDQDNVVTVSTRCICDTDPNDFSPASATVSTNPAPCVNPVFTATFVQPTCDMDGSITFESPFFTFTVDFDDGNGFVSTTSPIDLLMGERPASTITIRATDVNGCFVDDVVNVAEVTGCPALDPIPNCQNLTVDANTDCQGTAAAEEFDNGSTDASGSTDGLSFSLSDDGPYSLGTTNLVLTVTDDSEGTSETCDVMITVEDNTPPTFMPCPAGPLTVTIDENRPLNANDLYRLVRSDLEAVGVAAEDNCTSANQIAFLYQNGSRFFGCDGNNNGNLVEIRARDEADNVSDEICDFMLIVVDAVDPECPADIVVDLPLDTDGQLNILADLSEFTIEGTDNCDLAEDLTVVPAAGNMLDFDCMDVGTQTELNYTLVDGTDNESEECVILVTPIDVTPPKISCPEDITDVENDPGECGAVVSYSASAVDNCMVLLEFSPASGSFFEVGTTTVTVTTTDVDGNPVTPETPCTFDVTVLDTELPELTCPADETIDCDATPPAPFTAAELMTEGLASDNCSFTVEVNETNSQQDAGCGQYNFTIKREYIITDPAGLSVDCKQFITVEDVTPPVLTC